MRSDKTQGSSSSGKSRSHPRPLPSDATTHVSSRSLARGVSLAGLVWLLASLGCGGSGPEFHQVAGSIELPDGDRTALSGHCVEARLDSDPQVRAYGPIMADGAFTLETLHEGTVRRGAVAGSYDLRIVLSDDDAEARRKAASRLPDKVLQFETSGLSLDVPTQSSVVLRIAK